MAGHGGDLTVPSVTHRDSIVDMRSQYMVYWPSTGQNRYGETTVGTAEEIRVLIEKEQRQTVDNKADPVAFQYMISVPKVVTIGGFLWVGRLKNLPTSPTDLLIIIDFEEYTDDTGLLFDRWAKAMRYGDSLPS